MVKGQIHEVFKTFNGKEFQEVAVEAEVFCATVAAKSIAVLSDPGAGFFISIGYRTDEEKYSVNIVEAAMTVVSTEALDKQLAITADLAGGDTICHAFYRDRDGRPKLALLQHE